jgi:hypothetical protein
LAPTYKQCGVLDAVAGLGVHRAAVRAAVYGDGCFLRSIEVESH